MRNKTKLLGTSLKLHKGETVVLQVPTNLPKSKKVQWYATPKKNRDDFPFDASILIDSFDVIFPSIR